MCIRRNFSFCVLSPTEVAKEFCDMQVHILPLCTCGNREVCSWLRGVSRGFATFSCMCSGRGWRECSERDGFHAGLWTVRHLQLFTRTFL